LFDIGEDMVRNSEDKINDYLESLIDGNEENNNEKEPGNDYTFTEDEIKSRFVNEQGTDKFTKVEEYKSISLTLDDKLLNNLAEAEAGVSSLNTELENNIAKLGKSHFSLFLSLIYRKKSEQDIFILQVKMIQVNFKGNDFKVNALKDGRITFLFDDKEIIEVGKIINYQEGLSEELYLETNISLLSKIINSKTVEYRLQGASGVVSESKLSSDDIITFVGFYNVLFDSTYKKDEILSYMTTLKKKEEKLEEEVKKTEIEKEKEAEAEEEAESPSSCFVVTATMNDPNHPIVNDYRLYRDKYLLNNEAGLNFIKFYYRVGPYFASLINNSETLRKISFNALIKPLHKLIQKKFDTNND
jgi:ribosomal protein S8E